MYLAIQVEYSYSCDLVDPNAGVAMATRAKDFWVFDQFGNFTRPVPR